MSKGINQLPIVTEVSAEQLPKGVNALAGLTVPAAAIFSSIGTGTTFTDKSDRLQLDTTASATSQLRGGTISSISTPYTIDMAGGMMGAAASNDSIWFGLGLSDGTKYRTFYAGLFDGAGSQMRWAVDSWSNVTTFSAQVIVAQLAFNPAYFFIRITDDGSNRKFFLSANGKDFVQFYTEATNTYVTPSKFVLLTYNRSTAVAAKYYITHWLITGSVLGDAS